MIVIRSLFLLKVLLRLLKMVIVVWTSYGGCSCCWVHTDVDTSKESESNVKNAVQAAICAAQ